MARDFRPKGSKPERRPATTDSTAKTSSRFASYTKRSNTSDSAETSASHAAKPVKPVNNAYDSEDSADEETLMREIESFGGSREDLHLISRAGGAKQKANVDIDEAAFSSEVASFLEQLQKDPNASEPAASSSKSLKKPKEERKQQVKTEKEKGQSKGKVAQTDKAIQNETKAKDENKTAQSSSSKVSRSNGVAAAVVAPSSVQDSVTVKRMGKGKKMVFDDDGVGKETQIKPSYLSSGPLRLQAVPHWMSQTLPKLPEASSTSGLTHDRITQLLDLGSQLLQEENRAYDELTSSETSLHKAGGSIGTLTASDAHFVRSLLSSEGGGTVSDRISALTLLVQSSPVHNTKHLENLLNMSRKKSREESGRATRALADWLASEGGLGARKLRYFRDQPGLSTASAAISSADLMAIEAAKSHIVLWAFEDYLKKFYFQFLQVLETQSHDSISFTRKQAVSQIFILLRDKPEQEQNLLRLLVNKLGDPERSVAAKTSNHILELLTAHPAMKFIVVREIANLVLRPAPVNAEKQDSLTASNHNTHARYYGVLTLNQTVLTVKDEPTANHLILLYFELFEGILKRDELEEAKGTNVNDEAETEAKKKVDKKRWRDQPRKGKSRGKGGKAAGQKSTIPEEPKLVKDAESKMVAAVLTGVRRAFPFAKIESSVFEKHINTLFKLLHSSSFNICIQALQLIFQLTIVSPHKESSATLTSAAISDRFYRVLYDSLLDPRLESSSKQAMYLNLVFQALKADQELDRVKAFVKRLCQVLSLHQPSFICGCLHLLGELFRRTPGLRGMLTDPEEHDEEHFHDVAESGDDQDKWTKEGAEDSAAMSSKLALKYDGRKREPRFAHAGMTCLWDILPLVHHFHPSVSVHALQLVRGERITTNADLSLNTLSHFLDRFVFRNPKQKAAVRGVSAMQPVPAAASTPGSGVTRSRTHALAEDEVFNTDAFRKKQASSVPADQLFFHKFFNLKSQQPSTTRAQMADADDEEEDALFGVSGDELAGKKGVEDADEESDISLDSDDDPDEREIWKVMKATMPGKEELQGLDDSDDDADEFDYVDSDEENGGSAAGAAENGDPVVPEEGDDDDDGPRVIPGMSFSDEEEEVGEEDDWEDQSEGGNVFDEDEDDLLPFTAFADGKRGTKRGQLDDDDDEEEEEDDAEAGAKSKNKSKKDKKKRKKAMQDLPTFASAEDYAHLLGDDDEDL
ncbi:CBF-domain-containing protein [Testicularia cyperi]|uniref:CBF-domain-containing protein n=1 Tax=Testicularia cyperi TaxID=1882483 RepID=A0A317XTF1_9BASI|nr:CBF-domain-containing protein [Testicularia cyperi]